MFVGLHVAIATATRTPEFAINDEEGTAFMKAAQNVMRHYSVETTQKTLDWLAFGGICAQIYAPRIVAIAAKRPETVPQRPRPRVVEPTTPQPVGDVLHLNQTANPDHYTTHHDG